MIERVSFIGAGKVAGALSNALHQQGVQIVEICSRSASSKVLAEKVHAQVQNSIESMKSVDLIIVAVNDAAISSIVNLIPRNQAWAHTSGSIGLEDLIGDKKGVFYPLQTFSLGRSIDFSKIYFCLESNSPELLSGLDELASKLSSKRVEMNAEKRKSLHLAAVFACNFSNSLYEIAEELLAKDNLDFDMLRPLIVETALKVSELSPREAQTGPAQREDREIIERQLHSLKKQPEVQELYKLFTDRIIRKKNEEL